MFNVGGMELVVIALVALLVLGPDKLPGAIRQFGTVVGELRRMSSGFQTDLRGALADAERDAETKAAKKADAAGPSPDNHDPGAAEAVALAELAAIEGVHDASPPVQPTPAPDTASSNGADGSEVSDVNDVPSRSLPSAGDGPTASAS